jgi:hypothetical protein
VQYVLETCRTTYTYAVKRRQVPPYVGNPFSELPLDTKKVGDAKPIFVATAGTELKSLKACSAWAFPINFTLAKSGLRVGGPVQPRQWGREVAHPQPDPPVGLPLDDLLNVGGAVPGS